jgi:hypothetical protein
LLLDAVPEVADAIDEDDDEEERDDTDDCGVNVKLIFDDCILFCFILYLLYYFFLYFCLFEQNRFVSQFINCLFKKGV